VLSSRRVRVGSIGSALNAAKLVLAASALPALAVVSRDGDGGGAVLERRRDRRVAVGVRASGGGRGLVDIEIDVVRVGVGVDGGDIAAGLVCLFASVPGWAGVLVVVVELVVDACIRNSLESGERGVDLVGETLDLPMDLFELLGTLGEEGRSMLLRRE
jgi:hypothetical protein